MTTPHELIQQLGMQEYINIFLVQHDVRNAFMIQQINYKEPITFKLELIAIHFPDLFHTECYEGIILSKKSYQTEIFTTEKIGEILDYPDYNDFESIIQNIDAQSITCYLCVTFVNDSSHIQLFANRGKIENIEKTLKKMDSMCENANKVLYENIYLSKIIDKVYVKMMVVSPIKSFINKILMDDDANTLTEYDKSEISNHIWNLGLNKVSEYCFDYTNLVHKGILLTLLTYCNNNPMEAFYPLQKYKNEEIEVIENTEKWEASLLQLLTNTSV